MDVSKLVSRICEAGYCIVEEVIPADRTEDVCRQVVAAQQVHRAQSEAELQAQRCHGGRHRLIPGEMIGGRFGVPIYITNEPHTCGCGTLWFLRQPVGVLRTDPEGITTCSQVP